MKGCRDDALIAVTESHHPPHNGRQVGGKPSVALKKVDELTVRAWLAEALVRHDV